MQAILVLGYANDSKGRLAVISRERIELALKLWKHTPQAKLIASGGFSRRFNPTRAPHYEYVMEYMRRQGVPAEALLPGLPSEYTAHEAQLAARLIQEHSLTQLTVVTSDFHLPRARDRR